MRVGGYQVSISHRKFWRIAAVAAVGAMGVTSEARAAIFWSDSYPGVSQPMSAVPQRRQNSRRHVAKKILLPQKEVAKPQGPLIIAISIEKQTMKIYDANGFFAETPVSTGMPGHPTPMGVFSVIQKQKMHHSNIYSDAPMPFMQRITWSGVAMHAGVLPGRPASHGCIRMPMAFAVKMYGWTRNGARVVITPGAITPSSFSHPLLATQKVVPQPVTANETKTNLQTADLELRPTIAHDSDIKAAMNEPAGSAGLRGQTHTADASSNLPAIKAPDTMSDAGPDRVSTKTEEASNPDVKPEAVNSEAAKPEAEQAVAKRNEVASPDAKPVETKSAEAAAPEFKPVPADDTDSKPEEATATVKAETSAHDSAKPDTPKSDTAKPDAAKVDAPKSDTPTTAEKSDDPLKPAADAGIPSLTKDQTRQQDPEKATAAKPAPTVSAPKRSGQIAVFVSRKDQKLYVRQNFAPLFDVPVSIAPDERPLGTHVFTAQADKEDANVLHWSVVSLPAPSRRAERRDEDERTSRRRKVAGVVEMKPMPVPDSPAEALDRLTIPADTMARIVDLLSTGGSIIVSDQGIAAGETGEGTDFIVSLR